MRCWISRTASFVLAGVTLSQGALAQAPAAPVGAPIEARFAGEGIWTVKEKETGRDLCTLPCTATVPPGSALELHPVKIVPKDLAPHRYLPVRIDSSKGPRQEVLVTHPRDWSFTSIGIGAGVLGAVFLTVGVVPFHTASGTTAPIGWRVLSGVGGGLLLLGGVVIVAVLDPHYYDARVQPAATPPTTGAIRPRLALGADGVGIAF